MGAKFGPIVQCKTEELNTLTYEVWLLNLCLYIIQIKGWGEKNNLLDCN